MIVGYARVSTQDQRLDVQLDALSAAGCEDEDNFRDTANGKLAERPGLHDALGKLRKGDTFVAWKLDRLGRSVKQLVDLMSGFERKGVQFRSITDSIDTSTPAGRFFFNVMASLAEMERDLIVERTRAESPRL
jgi:DNA invertase Pin-like site-specific DNA recombinase